MAIDVSNTRLAYSKWLCTVHYNISTRLVSATIAVDVKVMLRCFTPIITVYTLAACCSERWADGYEQRRFNLCTKEHRLNKPILNIVYILMFKGLGKLICVRQKRNSFKPNCFVKHERAVKSNVFICFFHIMGWVGHFRKWWTYWHFTIWVN